MPGKRKAPDLPPPSKKSRAEPFGKAVAWPELVPPAPEDIRDDGDGWRWSGTLLYRLHPDARPAPRLAAFDFDGTLAQTSLFKKGPEAWSLRFPNVPEVLQALHAAGYALVIMSNQGEIGKATKSKDKTIAEKKGRLEGLLKAVGVPIHVFCATAAGKDADPHRKPGTGMWDAFVTQFNTGIPVDRAASFYVGDAAGRKGDHADTDKRFAAAVGVRFLTETEFFKDGGHATFTSAAPTAAP